MRLGQEHHESSDDRMTEHTLVDPNAGCGKRASSRTSSRIRGTGSTVGRWDWPRRTSSSRWKGELLWVYEGLTESWVRC